MARSKIIVDLAQNNVKLEIALKSLIIFLNSFDKPELLQWAKNELSGYQDGSELPFYRHIKGVIIGSFIVGDAFTHMKYTNHLLPINCSETEIIQEIHSVSISQNIKSLQKSIDENMEIAKPIPIDIANFLVQGTNISGVTSAKCRIDVLSLQNIVSSVEERVLEIFILLEKEFGNLDDYEINLTNKDETQLSSIINQITLIIFQDKSIKIGDKNKFSKSITTT